MSGANIKPWSDYLADLNRDWLRRVVNGGDPDTPADQRIRLKCTVLFGLKDRVVPAASSKSLVYLGETSAVNKGHIAMPKCQSKADPVYSVVTKFIKDSLSDAAREKLKQSVDNLSYGIRKGILDPKLEWTNRESELVELTPHPTMSPQVLNCSITSVREGWQPRNAVTICLRLYDSTPPEDIHIDFGFIFGQGALNQEEYQTLGDSLRAASLTKEEFRRLLAANIDLTLNPDQPTQTKVAFLEPTLQRGPGYACLHYPIANQTAVIRDNRLEIKLSTTLRRHQAWYGFVATRTVVGETKLQLTAPFKIYPLAKIWWCKAPWEPGTFGTDYFSSKITIPGPLPVGTQVNWVFAPEVYK